MRVLHWFRKGLRLHDNPALLATLNPPGKTPSEKIEPFFVYVYDTANSEYGTTGYRQAQFLHESLIALDKSLAEINKDFRLLVLKGKPDEVSFLYVFKLSEWRWC